MHEKLSYQRLSVAPCKDIKQKKKKKIFKKKRKKEKKNSA